MFDLSEIGKAFLILFAVIDVVGSIPVILDVRQKAGKIYPARATLVSLGIMVSFLYLGETILRVVGIDVRSFAVAGSLVLFFLALEMTLGVKLFKEDLSTPGLKDGRADNKVYSIVPLAFPVIAGAGTITTILSLRAEFERPNILVAILLNITPDHLDRYEFKMQNYTDAKMRITQNQTEEDSFIFWNDDPIVTKELAKYNLKSHLCPFSEFKEEGCVGFIEDGKYKLNFPSDFEMPQADMSLRGKHNIYNSLAAGLA